MTVPLGELVITPETTTAELKQLIAATFPTVTVAEDAPPRALTPDRLRLRELTSHKLNATVTVQRLGKVPVSLLPLFPLPLALMFALCARSNVRRCSWRLTHWLPV